MAITWVGRNIVCLAADTKPTNVPANTTAWETDTDNIYKWNGTSWKVLNRDPYSYIIDKDGSTYYATSKKLTNYSNTNASPLLNAAATQVLNAGGGLIFLKNAEYIIPDGSFPIDQLENVWWVGESRDKTIIRNQNTSYPPFYRIGLGNVPTFGISNMTLRSETANHCSVIYLGGSKDCVFNNCRFTSTITPSAWSFITFFDDVSKTRTHYRMKMNHCIYEGPTLGQDMFGSGELYHCDFSNNIFMNGDGQGYGVTTSIGCNFSDNIFFNIGNPLGLENVSQANTIHNNKLISCLGYLKMSYNIANEMSEGNSICFNKIFYGNSGIQDWNARDDIIMGNYIYRTKRAGIVGAFDRCIIANNQMIETNYDNNNLTDYVTGGASYKDGGIVSGNNTNHTTNDMNKIYGNIVRSGLPSFVVPTGYLDGGLTKTGFAGGIILDTSVTSAEIYDNTLWHTYNKIVKLGAGGTIRDNLGYLTENSGSFSITGNGSTTAFALGAHGLVSTPSTYFITPTSTAAAKDFMASADSVNMGGTYAVAPANGASLTYKWWARV